LKKKPGIFRKCPAFSKDARLFNHTGIPIYPVCFKKVGLVSSFISWKVFAIVVICIILLFCEDILLLYKVNNCRLLFSNRFGLEMFTFCLLGLNFSLCSEKTCEQIFLLLIIAIAEEKIVTSNLTFLLFIP